MSDDALEALVAGTLVGLDVLDHTARHFHPPRLPTLIDEIAPFRQPIADRLAAVEALPTDTDHEQAAIAAQVREVAGLTVRAFDEFAASAASSNPTIAAYRALGFATKATAALYPLTFVSPTVSRWFLEPDRRDDDALLAALAEGTRLANERANAGDDSLSARRGILHAANERDQRGGFSLYVPEGHQAGRPAPLVVALHGGSGHGRRFLWTWLRAARSSGAILLSPTSIGDTWGLMDPEPDAANLEQMVGFVADNFDVDPERVLLTGMSDGGTFSFVVGLRSGTPFTHLAPCSASFHPMLLGFAEPERLTGLPVRLLHGALDWMFPIDVARTAVDTLRAVGADVVYREIDDLSHTYPTEENADILEWLVR